VRRDPDHFGDQELSLIYVARKLKEALRLEEMLTEAGVDYLVEADKYTVGTIFRRERTGAFFYVLPDIDGLARDALRRWGLKPFDA
jgi:hypothetical protein